MTDPRYTDPRNDPQFSDPVSRRSNTMWGWIAGIIVVALVAFLLISGDHTGKQTASNPPPATAGSATQTMPPPTSTTGSATQTMPPPASTTGQGMATPAPTPMAPLTPTPSGKPAPSTK